MAGSTVWVKNGELLRSDKAARCLADEHGRFHFARPTDDFSLVMTHPSGSLRLRCSPQSIPETIKLAPWARVEGRLRVGGKPLPGARVDLALDNFDQHGPGDPQFFFTNTVNTDQNAGFVFERVVPGRGTVDTALTQSSSVDRVPTSSKRVPARFVAGRTTHVDLAKSGRPVIGQLQPMPARTTVTRIIVDPVDSSDKIRQLFATVDEDGNFCIDDVPVGNYRLAVLTLRDRNVQVQSVRQFRVPAINEKLSQRPVDLGVLTLDRRQAR